MRYLWLLFISTPLLANDTDFSLFLSQSEQHQFNENISHHIHPNYGKRITLKAIMMLDESNWTVWINDHKITQESCPDHIKILKVTDDTVDLIWKTEQGEQKLLLKANQTVDIKKDAPETQEHLQ